MVFRKLADYSKVAVYKCKLVDYSKAAVYKCKLVDYSKVVVYSKAVVYKCKLADYSKAAVYKCKPAVYTCKVLNSRFTTVLLITLLDTMEVTPFFQILFVKQWFIGVNSCLTINHHFTSCKLPLSCKPPLYKL